MADNDSEKKNYSADDVIKAWASQTGKLPTDFGLQEFENKDGGFSVALVNLETRGLVAQANGADAKECYTKLCESGVVTRVDPFVAPKDAPATTAQSTGIGYGTTETKTVSGADNIPAQDQFDSGVRTNQDVIDNLPKNDQGQVVIDADGKIEGLGEKDQPAPANAANTQAENSASTGTTTGSTSSTSSTTTSK